MTDPSPLPVGDPASLGFDPQRLARIGPAMQAFVDDRRVPNLITLVARRGQLAHLDARGVLTPDDPVSKYLPEFAESRVRLANDPMNTEPARRPITIRDCITNTTSLSPHISPRAAMIAQNFFRVRVLASGNIAAAYGGASMCAHTKKGQRGRGSAVCYLTEHRNLNTPH